MEEVFNNIYVLAAYGFLIYTVLMFVIEKDEYDGEGKKFCVKTYVRRNWDNWLLSLILVPIIATKAQDIWAGAMEIFSKEWTFYNIYYLGVGALVEALYTGVKWINNKRKKLSS